MGVLELEIKNLIIDALDLEDITSDDIDDDAPLFGDQGLGLDSIDALELGIALQKKFQLKLEANDADNHKHFFSVNSLASLVRSRNPQFKDSAG
jgi:acyl carrier protein